MQSNFEVKCFRSIPRITAQIEQKEDQIETSPPQYLFTPVTCCAWMHTGARTGVCTTLGSPCLSVTLSRVFHDKTKFTFLRPGSNALTNFVSESDFLSGNIGFHSNVHRWSHCFSILITKPFISNIRKNYINKKVLLRERKRHTARRVVSTHSVILSWLNPPPPRVLTPPAGWPTPG